MKDTLFPFQKTAVSELLSQISSAVRYYAIDRRPQVVAFRAPTGSGKTIIMASVIEDIFFGSEERPEQPDAVFVWLSDSPQLNEQSKNKIIQRSDKIQPLQCVTITEDSFDQELLDDGRIYFLNTQKLGKASRLVSGGDSRTFTIWETLQNTAQQKADHLYFIIDEAHRGMHDRKAATATTIMQKFLKGSEEDGLDAMPVVIGMSATDERFRRLVGQITSVRHDVTVSPDKVRSSGLLKERIVITYPDQDKVDNMVILQAAADEWKAKSDRWYYYCYTQHEEQVRPVFVIQVENRSDTSTSATEIDECIRRIQARTGVTFSEYEVVHTFGQTTTITVGELKIHHVEASEIADNKKIRLVFFKENLSTGWDCPRAETMMSFRRAEDATYIAQLLGRMIRTPLQRHITMDDSLNEVKLFLPYFNKDTVEKVMTELQNEEGGEIPADVEGEEYGNQKRKVWGYHPRKDWLVPGQISMTETNPQQMPAQDPLFADQHADENDTDPTERMELASQQMQQPQPTSQQTQQPGVPQLQPDAQDTPAATGQPLHEVTPEEEHARLQQENSEQTEMNTGDFDRSAVADFINKSALLTYEIKPFRNTEYLPSLIKLVSLIKNTGLDGNALQNVQQDGRRLIEDYIEEIRKSGEYDALAKDVRTLNLAWQAFDAFGEAIDNRREHSMFTTSDEDIDRQFRFAEAKLGGFGLGTAYGIAHFDPEDPAQYMIDVILFAANDDCNRRLHLYAKDTFHALNDKYRLQFVHLSEKHRKQYHDIIANGDEVSEHSFFLPEKIVQTIHPEGKKYYRHFFVDEDAGYAKIKLDSWEEKVIEEESKRDDFVCWIRNPSREKWSLCLKRYEQDKPRGFYPDFLIIRNDPSVGYVIDILEPHRHDLADNLSKARALMDYASKQPQIGRVQLIREGKDNVTGTKRMKRLDLAKSAVKDRVKNLQTAADLDDLFLDDVLVD